MKIANIFSFSKPDFPAILQNIAVWTYLNFAINLMGLWILKLISGSGFEYLQNIFNEFAKPILIQSVIYSVCLVAGQSLLTEKKYSAYVFIIFQFLIFNCFFFLNLKFKGGMHFETSWNNFGLIYFSYNGQYVVDIINYLNPLTGEFEGIFKPESTGKFYLYWIILINLYFLFLTYITQPVVRFFNSSKASLKE